MLLVQLVDLLAELLIRLRRELPGLPAGIHRRRRLVLRLLESPILSVIWGNVVAESFFRVLSAFANDMAVD